MRLKFLNMKTLETRRKIQMLQFLFKIIHDFPEIPTNLTNQMIINYDPRNGRSIIKGENRIDLSNKYMIQHSINLFNNLPKNVRCETNFCNFKCLINDLL